MALGSEGPTPSAVPVTPSIPKQENIARDSSPSSRSQLRVSFFSFSSLTHVYSRNVPLLYSGDPLAGWNVDRFDASSCRVTFNPHVMNNLFLPSAQDQQYPSISFRSPFLSTTTLFHLLNNYNYFFRPRTVNNLPIRRVLSPREMEFPGSSSLNHNADVVLVSSSKISSKAEKRRLSFRSLSFSNCNRMNSLFAQSCWWARSSS